MTKDDLRKLRTIANWRRIIPTLVTLSALFFGFASILTTLESMRLGVPALLARSAQYIMLALILDGLDGNLARWLKGSTDFGAELDTFVDFSAFGAAPAVLMYALLLHGPSPFWRTILPSAIVFSGALRLSKFRLKDPLRGQGGFIGLPITVNSSWIALSAFAAQILYPDDHILVTGPVSVVFQFLILVMISLQLSNLRYPKPSNKVRYFAPAALVVFLLWILSETYAAWIALFLVLGCLAYVLTGPMIHKRSALKRAEH
ncbi:CDP-alcohol phosphatidyltransferase family protein [Aminivibrio sp.]|jgi:CDP-diacylglycerol--serine O-phosphatidyltransferase|uniref:CDP-alcohol phosphatidyltransferase family protein n=1 Tax=Aminivibrio sp. TaxID=1872489 RepID=UPI001A5C6282|nr:CDP-alcohol phosphatidyltransferase family protein [Aminivibrio sp.]MBL3538210.1 CDP-alcohol phosphatidyltransferase family protein [Aminivibrio sp.]